MFHFPKPGMIALDARHTIAYRMHADDQAADHPMSFLRDAAIHAISITGMIVFLAVLLIL